MKKTISALFAIASAAVFAGAGDLLVMFSTPGPDKYADGTDVLVGETYGLFYTDEQGVQNPNPVFTYRTKSDGCCTPVMFVIDENDAGKYRAGKLEVYLLDTRDNNGSSMGTPKGIVAGEPIVKSKTASASVTVSNSDSINSVDSATSVAFDIPEPVITGIDFDDDKVLLGVKGLVPCVGYAIKSGANTTEITTPAGEISYESETTIVIPKPTGSQSQFFRVTTAK